MKKNNRIGETNKANNGQMMTIVKYTDSQNIIVEFEDGTTVNTTYYRFKNGKVKNSNYRIGKVNIANNGQTMEIIEYINSHNITVKFEDDTTVNTTYYDFKIGRVKNPNFYQSRIGETNKANNGQIMKIIEYTDSQNIIVEFEDGITVKAMYKSFKNGEVSNPNLYQSRIGETNITNNGQTMTIIKYVNAENITVKFEDNTTVDTTYYNFQHGSVRNPNFYQSRIGETNIANNGQMMKIIEYTDSQNIIVEFKDGTTVKTTYYRFHNGSVSNPNYRIGETNRANNGQIMKIIEYIDPTHITVKFEDDTTINTTYHRFKNGKVNNLPISSGEASVKNILNNKNIEYFHDLTIRGTCRRLGIMKLYDMYTQNYQDGINMFSENINFCRGRFDYILTKNRGIDALIEIDGAQHFVCTTFFYPSTRNFLNRVDYDKAKTRFAEINNIPLLRIRYDQLDADTIKYMIDDFLANPEKYITQHNTFLSEEEYWQPLKDSLNSMKLAIA